ncbi:MAG: DUF1353 domain-containing protein [Acidimicrobiales bacterium]
MALIVVRLLYRPTEAADEPTRTPRPEDAMPFIAGDIVVKQIGDKDFELVEPVSYAGNAQTFTVPAGFRTDLASVPRAFVWLLPRYGRYTRAAILHDYLWRNTALLQVSRADADWHLPPRHARTRRPVP